MEEENIKESFQKVKKDIEFLREELIVLNENFFSFKQEIDSVLDKILQEIHKISIQNTPTHPTQIPTDLQHISNTPTHHSSFQGLKRQNIKVSNGNEGVPTDRQQTDNKPTHPVFPLKTDKIDFEYNKNKNKENLPTTNFILSTTRTPELSYSKIENASEILDSLDELKREIGIKFKKLTEQEFLVFSTIYQMGEEGEIIDYRSVAQKLGLTESSIRDYIGRLLKKGISVDKIKINNKNVRLSISQDFKKIASLPTILQLRGI